MNIQFIIKDYYNIRNASINELNCLKKSLDVLYMGNVLPSMTLKSIEFTERGGGRVNRFITFMFSFIF